MGVGACVCVLRTWLRLCLCAPVRLCVCVSARLEYARVLVLRISGLFCMRFINGTRRCAVQGIRHAASASMRRCVLWGASGRGHSGSRLQLPPQRVAARLGEAASVLKYVQYKCPPERSSSACRVAGFGLIEREADGRALVAESFLRQRVPQRVVLHDRLRVPVDRIVSIVPRIQI